MSNKLLEWNDIVGPLGRLDDSMSNIDPWLFAVALVASLIAALAASGLYCVFYERRGTGSQVHRAFPLLALAITTLFIGVQVSLPLSLGLLGSLSIIRFRTPIKEPEEVGFIMLVIAGAISCATFHFLFLVILFSLATLTLVALKGRWLLKSMTQDGTMIAVLPAADLAKSAELLACLGGKARRAIMESTSSRDGKVSLQFSFTGLKCPVSELHADVQRVSSALSVNIFLNRPGGTP